MIEFNETELKTIYLSLSSFANFLEFNSDTQLETLRTAFYLETNKMLSDSELYSHIHNSIELGNRCKDLKQKIESYFDIMNINYNF